MVKNQCPSVRAQHSPHSNDSWFQRTASPSVHSFREISRLSWSKTSALPSVFSFRVISRSRVGASEFPRSSVVSVVKISASPSVLSIRLIRMIRGSKELPLRPCSVSVFLPLFPRSKTNGPRLHRPTFELKERPILCRTQGFSAHNGFFPSMAKNGSPASSPSPRA